MTKQNQARLSSNKVLLSVNHTKIIQTWAHQAFLLMASSLLPTFTIPFAKPRKTSLLLFTSSTSWTPSFNVVTKCESKESSGSIPPPRTAKLEIGSPVIVVEAPKMIKTAASVPCLRINSGFVKPGDVGRIVSRKPKDVWAVRLSIGTYLIDAKYFKPLDLPE